MKSETIIYVDFTRKKSTEPGVKRQGSHRASAEGTLGRDDVYWKSVADKVRRKRTEDNTRITKAVRK